MRKNKLIELLQSIEGNPEILLWNGYVGDYMDIDKDLAERSLVKMTFPHYVNTIWMEELRDNPELGWDHKFSDEKMLSLKKSYKQYIKWEFNEYVYTEDIAEKHYMEKQIVLINSKPRGVKTFDRWGDISY